MRAVGYARYGEEQESGLHPHQDDDPAKVLGILRPIYKSVIFQVARKEQFAVQWVIWVYVRGEVDSEPDEQEEEVIPTKVTIIHRDTVITIE